MMMSFLDYVSHSPVAMAIMGISILAANLYLLFNIKSKQVDKYPDAKSSVDIIAKPSDSLQNFAQRVAPIISIIGLIVLIFLYLRR